MAGRFDSDQSFEDSEDEESGSFFFVIKKGIIESNVGIRWQLC